MALFLSRLVLHPMTHTSNFHAWRMQSRTLPVVTQGLLMGIKPTAESSSLMLDTEWNYSQMCRPLYSSILQLWLETFLFHFEPCTYPSRPSSNDMCSVEPHHSLTQVLAWLTLGYFLFTVCAKFINRFVVRVVVTAHNASEGTGRGPPQGTLPHS